MNAANVTRKAGNILLDGISLRGKLFIPQGLDRIQFGGARSGINAGAKAHENGKADGAGNHPPRYGREIDWRQFLPAQVNIRTERERGAD